MRAQEVVAEVAAAEAQMAQVGVAVAVEELDL
jgi:hypothetical protein